MYVCVSCVANVIVCDLRCQQCAILAKFALSLHTLCTVGGNPVGNMYVQLDCHFVKITFI